VPLKKLDYSNAHVLVIGDVMLDSYWHGSSSRLSPEAPVPIVAVERFEHRAGGAANVATNIASLGGFSSLLGIVGDDTEATLLKDCLKNARIKYQFISAAGKKTITKLRVLSRQQHMIRLDLDSHYHEVSDDLLKASYPLFDKINMVVLSDYAKGTLKNVQEIIDHAKALHLPVIVDPKSKEFSIYRGATIITPNLAEFEAAAGHCENDKALISKAKTMCHDLMLHAVLITRGEKGMILIGPDIATLDLPAEEAQIVDITGAGDTVVASLACSLASGYSLFESVNLSNKAASIVVKKLGTASITLSELQNTLYNSSDNTGIFSH
jgi:D-beta-D-heptose 7-phosphate kinase / D-beta-D-heptose 1-phosphate adenosyltransferase